MKRSTTIPSALRAICLIQEVEEDGTDGVGNIAGEVNGSEADAPLPSHDAKFDALKKLAKRDLPTLRHLAALKKVHDAKANLTGTDAKLAIQAILNRLDQVDPAAATQLGQKNWDPNVLAWIELFDTIGDKKLGDFVGISSHADIPKGSAAEIEGGDASDVDLDSELSSGGGNDEPEQPASEEDDTSEVEAVLKGAGGRTHPE